MGPNLKIFMRSLQYENLIVSLCVAANLFEIYLPKTITVFVNIMNPHVIKVNMHKLPDRDSVRLNYGQSELRLFSLMKVGFSM